MDLIQKIWKLIAGLYERFRELFWYGVFGVLTTIINMAAFQELSDGAIRYAYDHSDLEQMAQKYREMFE